MTPAIIGMMTSSISRRDLLRRPESGFFLVSAAAGACSPGNLSTGSAIAALLALARLASRLVGGADIRLDLIELGDEAVGLVRRQMRQRRLIDLLAQGAQLRHQRSRRRRQIKAVGA